MSDPESGNYTPSPATAPTYHTEANSQDVTQAPETQEPLDTPLASDPQQYVHTSRAVGVTSEEGFVPSGANLTQDSNSVTAEQDDDDNGTEGGSTAPFSDQFYYDMGKRSRGEKAKKRRKSEDDDSTKKPSGKYKLKRKKVGYTYILIGSRSIPYLLITSSNYIIIYPGER